MASIKLDQLPDRTPVKLGITITPDLHLALQSYTAAYEQSYGVTEPLIELIPAILAAFLASDKAFVRDRDAHLRGQK